MEKLEFLMFENETNVCWLDASITLIAHNKTFKKIVESSLGSQINKIIATYNEAIITFNGSDCEQKLKSPEMLKTLQNSTLKYLKQFLKFKTGEPDSAFCALLNLIYQDKSNIKECLNVSWIWRKQCSNCGMISKSAICKPIVTLSKVDVFHPECPSSIYTCTCKSEQKMKLIYKELPPCLIFHFEKGAGTGTSFPLDFCIKGREYQLTGIIILEKSSMDLNLNHFITWIRNPASNQWLECNDLNPGVALFSPIKPEFCLKDIYILVYEAFDDLGKINNEIASDQEQDVENANVELIDLSDEENNTASTSSCCKTSISESSKSVKNNKCFNNSKNSLLKVDASKKQLLTDDKKDIALQNLKMCGDEKPVESEKSCNVKDKKKSLCNQNLSIKISDKHKIEAKSKTFGNQDKSIDFNEAKNSRSEASDDPEHEVSESSIPSKKETLSCSSVNNETTSSIENLEMHNNEKHKKCVEDCNISYQKISVSNFNLPNKLFLNKQKTEEKSVKKSLEVKKFKTKSTDNLEHKIAEASDGSKKGSCSISINKNVSTIENLEMGGNENIKKSSLSISDNSHRFSNENSNKPKVVTESKNCQDKSIKELFAEATKYPEPKVKGVSIRCKEEKKLNLFDLGTVADNITANNTRREEPTLIKCGFIKDMSDVRKNEIVKKSLEAKKFKAKSTNNPEHKVTEASDRTKKENCSIYTNKNAVKNLEMCSNENVKKNTLNISDTIHRFPNESSNKHKVEIKSKICQDKSIKEIFAEATKYPEPKVIGASIRRKEEKKLNLFDPGIVENITEDDTTREELSLTKCGYIKDSSDGRKNEKHKYDKKKSQIKMKQITLKEVCSYNNKNKYVCSNEVKRERTEDNYGNLSKKRKERQVRKYASPNKEKNYLTASTSLADGELTKDTLCRSKTSKSARKKIKISNRDEKHSSKSSPSKISTEKIRSVVDIVVTRTFAAFFEKMVQTCDTTKQMPDSTT